MTGQRGIALSPGYSHPKGLELQGEIAEGYDASTVIIWNKGTYNLLESGEGRFVVELRRECPAGRYALARSSGKEKEKKNWFKMRTS